VDLFRGTCGVYELVDTCGVYEHVDVIYIYIYIYMFVCQCGKQKKNKMWALCREGPSTKNPLLSAFGDYARQLWEKVS
jgi:hypothetical protein